MTELLRDLLLVFMLILTAVMSFEAGVRSARKTGYEFKEAKRAFVTGVEK